ncbi:class I SAM-dependent methyltransferase [Mycolicibacterium neworleansense]|uniref:SAM dependent carboxyl methyltransferase n=1 Tax=Mycolicibacterium neworleansense TaxID=146018 RepID=A0A0H5RY96_9MYCO|nr:SAM-dependent methyltransferase [Mycolicibacterium neworleansense]MCV7361907.1 SAM-dependent methyltransferase [Mycolicibacterium neworleansense]CRZ13689.1 SAM dependent carboxyl methyltransferase [Mycolicibacterium neworleansense]
MSSAIKLLELAARTVPIPAAPQPVVIADYGAGTAQNSMQPINAAIAAVRGRTRPEHSILVTHTDTADNDFSTMFRILEDDPESYLHKDPATFSSAIGRSFYSQILPSNSVHLGWSAWAIVRLGRVPMPVADHVVAVYSRDERVRTAYARQAAHDWHEFVAFRGRELAPGGRLVVLTTALDDEGDFGYRPLFRSVVSTLAELVSDGVVSADEVARMSLPIAGRCAADFAAPFAPSGRFERMEVQHVELFDAEDRIFNAYRGDRNTSAFGTRWADFCRFTSFADLGAALGGSPDRVPVFYDRLHAGIAARLASDPEEMRIPIAAVVLEKRRRNS